MDFIQLPNSVQLEIRFFNTIVYFRYLAFFYRVCIRYTLRSVVPCSNCSRYKQKLYFGFLEAQNAADDLLAIRDVLYSDISQTLSFS